MLTEKQRKLLDFIQNFEASYGYCPSFGEMLDALGIKSKSGIYRLLAGLEERGCIIRLRGKERAIKIIYYPDQYNIGLISDAALLEECSKRGLITFTHI